MWLYDYGANFQVSQFWKFQDLNFRKYVHVFSHKTLLYILRLTKIYVFETCPISFIRWSHLVNLKTINKGSQGLTNPKIMEFGGSGPSHKKTKLYYIKNDQNNSPELLNLLLKNMFHKMTRTMPNNVDFFRWFSYDCHKHANYHAMRKQQGAGGAKPWANQCLATAIQ